MKIASLGLLPYGKKIIEDYIFQYKPLMTNQCIDWLPINGINFKTVIVHSSFLGSFEVEKHLNELPFDINILGVCADKSYANDANQYTIPILNFFEKDSSKIRNWVNTIRDIKIEENINSETKSVDSINNISKINSAEDVNHFFLLLNISKNIIHLTTESGASIWINCSNSRVYLNIINKRIPAIERYEYQILSSDFDIATINELIDIYTISLNEWLWEVMWRTNVDLSPLISEDSRYKLVRWPHFCNYTKLGRTESLRLSSRINRQAISYNQLLIDSGYSKNIVNKFVCSMLQINYIKEVSITSVTKPKKLIISNQITNNLMMKNFLNKIRKIIGL